MPSIFYLVLYLLAIFRPSESLPIPTFYVDPNILDIFQPRIISCMGGTINITSEIDYLRSYKASEYFRSHELYAYGFFIDNLKNPYRSFELKNSEFEYIPILPLSWRVSRSIDCTYKRLIQDMLKCIAYLKERNKKLTTTIPPMFMVFL